MGWGYENSGYPTKKLLMRASDENYEKDRQIHLKEYLSRRKFIKLMSLFLINYGDS